MEAIELEIKHSELKNNCIFVTNCIMYSKMLFLVTQITKERVVRYLLGETQMSLLTQLFGGHEDLISMSI